MNQSDRKQNRPLIKPLAHWHLIAAFLIVYDFVAVVATWFLALRLRFDGRFAAIPAQYFLPYKRFILPCALFCILVFVFFRMWHLASSFKLERLFLRLLLSFLISSTLRLLLHRPLSYCVLGHFFLDGDPVL